MHSLIPFAKELVAQATAIRNEHQENVRQQLPLSEPPKTWSYHPSASDEFNKELVAAIFRLHLVAGAVRKEGFGRMTYAEIAANSRPIGSRFCPQDFDDAIRLVDRMLVSDEAVQ